MLDQVISLIIGLLGGGGLVALLRVRTQNRVDERTQLSSEQVSFRQSMAAELAEVRAENRTTASRNDTLEKELREQGKLLAALEERDAQKTEQLKLQAQQILELKTQNAAQAQQLTQLTEEKAKMTQKLAIVQAQYEFVERENGELRRENERLRSLLPVRVDLGDQS